MTDPRTPTEARWLSPGVRGIGAASFLADVGHQIPTALLPNLLTATLGAPASALGLIEGIADGLAGGPGWPVAPWPTTLTVAGPSQSAAIPPPRCCPPLSGPPPPCGRSGCCGPAPGPPGGCGSRPATPYWPTSCRPASTGEPTGSSGPATTLAPCRSSARAGPGGPGRGPHRHCPVGHPRPAGRGRHRGRHSPRAQRRAARAATAAAAHPAGADRPAGSAHGHAWAQRWRPWESLVYALVWVCLVCSWRMSLQDL